MVVVVGAAVVLVVEAVDPDPVFETAVDDVVAVPEPLDVVVVVELAPGCSWATMTPIRADKPVTTSAVAAVTRRIVRFTRPRSPGVVAGMELDIRTFLSRDQHHRTIGTSSRSQGRLCAACEPGQGPEVGSGLFAPDGKGERSAR
ncbi:MAG TPA: hypothetical protein VGG38_03530 [Acidimicrobiales bacterium]